ncbi:hypothetical protein ACHAXS_008515 [Conticribra weissflogii]
MPILLGMIRQTVASYHKKPFEQLFNLNRRLLSTGSSACDNPRLRRSVHFVPGDNDKFLSKCLAVGADTVVLDLEDSVKDKFVGREKVNAFLNSSKNEPGRRKTEVLVRINPVSSNESWQEDIESGFEGADGFMVPKVETKQELIMLDELLSEMERKLSFDKNIPPKLGVLVFAPSLGDAKTYPPSWEAMAPEKTTVGNISMSSDIVEICVSWPQRLRVYKRLTGFEAEAREAKIMGFDGKLTLHPDQVSAIHRVLAPTAEELSEALDIVSIWEQKGGKGSMELRGKMIDKPHYVRAKKVIGRKCDDIVEAENSSVENSTKDPLPSNNIAPANVGNLHVADFKEEEIFPRVYLGKYFEELEPGLRIRHFLTRTVTESDNVFFTCLTLNPAPIHLDHELSKENTNALSGGGSKDVGKPLFNSMFTLALLVGMSVPEATHGTTVANLGFSEVLFPKPVYPGDTLRAETIVLDRRESKSRPSQGIVTLQHIAYNQRGEVVCKATRQALMKKR